MRARDVEMSGCGSRCLGDGKADVGGWSPGALSSGTKSSSEVPARVSWSMSGTYRSYSVGHLLLVRGLERGADPKVAQLGLPRLALLFVVSYLVPVRDLSWNCLSLNSQRRRREGDGEEWGCMREASLILSVPLPPLHPTPPLPSLSHYHPLSLPPP